MEDELLDLFDANEQVIGTVLRSEYYRNMAKYPGYLRSAELFIRNDKGQLWIPRRSADRKVAPSGLDYSCGGHVSSGEDYLLGCMREAEEELRLQLKPEDLTLLFKTDATEASPWFRSVYLYQSSDAPEYNTEDFSEYYWLTPQELIDKIEAGEPSKESMLVTLQVILPKLNAL
jgi:isopentenyl-diphosphate delta-isomerase